ncbi:hypothetical protein EZV73_01890 [Acidaminobacter sp. JC074]|uniref:hypothetical protein n=1 Tax=Acidaminobacter sp. JC074 TaxID=2530199 RepID=UPI001F0E1173|nr:hypothetical protein [Acidaminobacter sp. JC074]MCH4886296.1 hypothetical protein [Acidaminobacter sp. JC074]
MTMYERLEGLIKKIFNNYIAMPVYFYCDRPAIPMTFNIRDESLVVDVNEFFQYILLIKDSEASER